MLLWTIIFTVFILSQHQVQKFNTALQIRTGKISVIRNGSIVSTDLTVSFQYALQEQPTGVVLSIKTLQVKQQQIRKLDYGFLPSNQKKIGFDMNILHSNVQFERISIDYFVASYLNYFNIFSILSNTSLSKSITVDYWQYKWNVNIYWQQNIQIQNINVIPSIIQSDITYPSSKFTTSWSMSYSSSNPFVITIVFKFPKQTIVMPRTKLSVIVGCFQCNTGLKQPYLLTYLFYLFDTKIQEITLQNMNPFGMFLTLAQTNGNSTKIDFYFQIDFKQNQSIFLLQQRGVEILTLVLQILHLRKNNCSDFPLYPFLQFQTQYCYESCPITKYANSVNHCIPCTKCQDIFNCQQCYINGCNTTLQYFNNQSFSCTICSQKIQNCQTCVANSLGVFCVKCVYQTQLKNNLCLPCNISTYFDNQNNHCKLCSSQYFNCETCTTLGCLKCFQQFVLFNNTCVTCADGTFPSSTSCQICLLNCKICSNSYNCNQCNDNFIFVNDYCLLIKIQNIQVFDRQIKNQISMNPDTQTVLSDYNMFMFFNDKSIDFSYTIKNHKQIVTTFAFNESIDKIKVKILFVPLNVTFTDVIIQYQINQVFYISIAQKEIYDSIDKLLDRFSNNFGAFFTSVSLTSTMSYFLSIIWTFQITSLYLYLPMTIPKNLFKVLSAMNKLNGLDLLPFSINLFQSSKYEVVSDRQIYQQMNFDLFFVRNNIQQWIQIVVVLVLYKIIYQIVNRFKSKNILIKFLKRKFVKQHLSTYSILLTSIFIDLGSSSATSLTVRKFTSLFDILNYLSAFIGLIVGFALIVFIPLNLFVNKTNNTIDTQDTYFGLKRFKKNSQLILSVFMLSNICVAISIPLFPPIFSFIIVIILVYTTTWSYCKYKPMKLKSSYFLRLLQKILMLSFNLTFVILYIFNHFSVKTKQILGYCAMFSLAGIIIFQFLQSFIQISYDIYKFILKFSTNNKKSKQFHQKQKINQNKNNLVVNNNKLKRISKRIGTIDTISDRRNKKRKGMRQFEFFENVTNNDILKQ